MRNYVIRYYGGNEEWIELDCLVNESDLAYLKKDSFLRVIINDGEMCFINADMIYTITQKFSI